MASALVLNVLRTETLQSAAVRNQIEYEQALYWANAGVHHACAEIMQNASWMGSLSEGVVPPSAPAAGYVVTSEDGGNGNVLVTSTGYAGEGQRTVQATISL